MKEGHHQDNLQDHGQDPILRLWGAKLTHVVRLQLIFSYSRWLDCFSAAPAAGIVVDNIEILLNLRSFAPSGQLLAQMSAFLELKSYFVYLFVKNCWVFGCFLSKE